MGSGGQWDRGRVLSILLDVWGPGLGQLKNNSKRESEPHPVARIGEGEAV